MDLHRNSRNSDKNSTFRDRSTSASRRIPNFEENFEKFPKKHKSSPLPCPTEQTRSYSQAKNGVSRKIGFLDFSSSGEEEEFLEEENEPDFSMEYQEDEINDDYDKLTENANIQSYRNQKMALNRGNGEGYRFSIYSFLLGFIVGSFLIGFIFYSQKPCKEATKENLQIYWRNFEAHPEIRYINECWQNFVYRSLKNREQMEKGTENFQKTDQHLEKELDFGEIRSEVEKVQSSSATEFTKSLEQVIIDGKLEENDANLLKKVLNRWLKTPSEDPTVIAIVGSEEKSRNLIRNILASILENEKVEEKLLEATNRVNRVDLYEWFYETLTGGGLRVSAVIDIQKLRWDSPLSLHAWTDDGQPMKSPPPIARSLILLGVSVDEEDGYEKVHNDEKMKCQGFLQKFLLKKWSLSGGTYSMMSPIVNSRIDYSFCLSL